MPTHRRALPSSASTQAAAPERAAALAAPPATLLAPLAAPFEGAPVAASGAPPIAPRSTRSLHPLAAQPLPPPGSPLALRATAAAVYSATAPATSGAQAFPLAALGEAAHAARAPRSPSAPPVSQPSAPAAAPTHGAAPAARAAAGGGSRRRRLWELDGHAHCPVVGVCLPLPLLRRLLAKIDGGTRIHDDYELHCTMVGLAKRRGTMAEAMQRELDRRYLLPLREAAQAKGEAALQRWWDDASAGNNLGAALWATLTHPCCSPALQDRVLGQVHMHQHQVGMATRVELARFEQLIDENSVLARTLAQAQQRCTRQAADFARRSQHDEAQLLRCRAELIGCRSELQISRAQLAELQQADPDRSSRRQLAAERRALQERLLQTQRELQQTQLLLQQAQQHLAQLQQLQQQPPAQPPAAPAAHGRAPVPAAPAPAMQLNARAVLCVGGRLASVPIYRRLIERVGGRFLHHDGGDEDSPHRLDATLAAADLVICQTGCISHGAYWRVKEHCKRTGKRCMFVEVPSRHAIEQALARAVVDEPAA